MNRLQLQRNVQFMYEEQLARLELRALGCEHLARVDDDDGRHLVAHLNGNTDIVRQRSAYLGWLDEDRATYADLIRPSYQGGQYNRTRSPNQYLTHWIYPYQGKFHPQMVRALFNILGARPGDLALDPFVGSGTSALEASLLGLRFVGVDLSPLCAMLTRVKTRSVEAVPDIRERVRTLLARERLDPDDAGLGRERNPRVREFVQMARMVTFSDAARRGRAAGPWLRKNLTKMLASVEAHAAALEAFRITPGPVDVRVGDARALDAAGIEADSVDVCVTSPPYSIALDYVANDEHALDAMRVDVRALRDAMTGVRGTSAHDKMARYNEDIRLTFREVARVLKPGAAAAFVVGDATVDGREITTTGTMVEWAEAAGLRCERNISKIVFGLYAVMKDEKILVLRKPKL